MTAQAEHLRAEVRTDEQWDVGWAYMNCVLLTWHILGDRLVHLAPLSLVGFYM